MQAGSSRNAHRAITVIAGILLAVAASACNVKGTDVPPAGQVHSVTLPTHALTDTSCQRIKLTPKVSADTTVFAGVTWSSSDSTVANVDSLGGILGLTPGSARVTATSVYDKTKSDTVRVVVVDPTGPFVSITGLRQADTGLPATLSAVHDSVDVVLAVKNLGCRLKSTPRWVRADVTISNGRNALAQAFPFTGGIAGAVFLRVNTGQKDASGNLLLPNGPYTVTASVTDTTGTRVTAPAPLSVTLANQ